MNGRHCSQAGGKAEDCARRRRAVTQGVAGHAAGAVDNFVRKFASAADTPAWHALRSARAVPQVCYKILIFSSLFP
jgi:hypothetical protein